MPDRLSMLDLAQAADAKCGGVGDCDDPTTHKKRIEAAV